VTAAEGFGIASAAFGGALLVLAAISTFRLVVADLRGLDCAGGAADTFRAAFTFGAAVGLLALALVLLRR